MAKRLSILLCIVLSCLFVIQAQDKQVKSIEIIVVTTGDGITNYKSQIEKYLKDEIIKLKDIKVDTSDADFLLVVYFLDLPQKCGGYDFHYRAHLINQKDRLAPLVETSSIQEGFESYADLKDLLVDIVFNLNKYWLHQFFLE